MDGSEIISDDPIAQCMIEAGLDPGLKSASAIRSIFCDLCQRTFGDKRSFTEHARSHIITFLRSDPLPVPKRHVAWLSRNYPIVLKRCPFCRICLAKKEKQYKLKPRCTLKGMNNHCKSHTLVTTRNPSLLDKIFIPWTEEEQKVLGFNSVRSDLAKLTNSRLYISLTDSEPTNESPDEDAQTPLSVGALTPAPNEKTVDCTERDATAPATTVVDARTPLETEIDVLTQLETAVGAMTPREPEMDAGSTTATVGDELTPSEAAVDAPTPEDTLTAIWDEQTSQISTAEHDYACQPPDDKSLIPLIDLVTPSSTPPLPVGAQTVDALTPLNTDPALLTHNNLPSAKVTPSILTDGFVTTVRFTYAKQKTPSAKKALYSTTKTYAQRKKATILPQRQSDTLEAELATVSVRKSNAKMFCFKRKRDDCKMHIRRVVKQEFIKQELEDEF